MLRTLRVDAAYVGAVYLAGTHRVFICIRWCGVRWWQQRVFIWWRVCWCQQHACHDIVHSVFNVYGHMPGIQLFGSHVIVIAVGEATYLALIDFLSFTCTLKF